MGGKGDDVLTGSDGDDTFIVSVSDVDGERDAGTDVITDFNPSDVIAFTGFGISKSQDGSLPQRHLFQKTKYQVIMKYLFKNKSVLICSPRLLSSKTLMRYLLMNKQLLHKLETRLVLMKK